MFQYEKECSRNNFCKLLVLFIQWASTYPSQKLSIYIQNLIGVLKESFQCDRWPSQHGQSLPQHTFHLSIKIWFHKFKKNPQHNRKQLKQVPLLLASLTLLIKQSGVQGSLQVSNRKGQRNLCNRKDGKGRVVHTIASGFLFLRLLSSFVVIQTYTNSATFWCDCLKPKWGEFLRTVACIHL